MDDMHDLVAPYALDALDADEVIRFEAHLDTCESCRVELARLTEGTADLAESVAVAPPGRVKDAVFDQIGDDSTSNVTRIEPRRNPGWVVAGVAAVLALVFFGLWMMTNSQLTESERLAAIYEAPDATVVELDGSHGPARFVYSPSLGEGVLNGSRLAEIAESDIYEMWVISGDGAQAAGTFQPGEQAVFVEGIDEGVTFAVTVEEAPGVEQSNNEPVLAVEI